MVPLSWYLVVAALLFGVGVYGVLARKNAVAVLIGLELMFNAVLINVLAFWRYLTPMDTAGLVFAVIIFAVAAAEVAVGLALFIAVYRKFGSSDVDDIALLKW